MTTRATAAELVLVLTTLAADADVDSIARTLVEERLAACVNIHPPMSSVFRWKGAVERTDERQLVIKTTAARVSDLEVRLRALHTYEVPEFLVLSVSAGTADYLAWAAEQVAPPAES